MQMTVGLAVFVLLSAWEAHDQSPTFDEPAHVTAAYVSLALDDYRLLPEQPPLGRRLAAVPLLFQDVDIPSLQTSAWREARYFDFGFKFFHQGNHDATYLLASARCAMLFWGALLIASVFAVARQCFGAQGGLISLSAAVFNPTLLGHAHLVTTDTAAACLIFLSVATFERWLDRPDPRRSAAAGVLLGGAICAKLSALVLLPVFGLLVLARTRRERTAAGAPQTDAARAPGRWARVGAAALLALTAYGTIWGAYGFRYRASPEVGFQLSNHLHYAPFSGRLLTGLASYELLPEAFLCGLAELRNHAAAGHTTFAAGERSKFGWWWYFPFVFLVKSPVSLLALAAAGLVAWRKSGVAASWAVASTVTVVLVTGSLIASPLNLGLRHAMPVFPFVFLACGAGARAFSAAAHSSRFRSALAALTAGLILESMAAAPYFIAYFNGPALVTAERHELLLDSNLDWGQDLRRLKSFMEARGIERVKLAYLGTDSPRRLGLRHEILRGNGMYVYFEPEWPWAGPLRPGDYVAVSVNYLAGDAEEPFRSLRLRHDRVARLGHAMHVYRIRPP